jgi:hypothetical protein
MNAVYTDQVANPSSRPWQATVPNEGQFQLECEEGKRTAITRAVRDEGAGRGGKKSGRRFAVKVFV